MCSLGGIINPIGVLAKKIGGPVGAVMDPVATIGKKVGGPVGAIIDPAATADKMTKPAATPRARSVLTQDEPDKLQKKSLITVK